MIRVCSQGQLEANFARRSENAGGSAVFGS